MKHKIKRTYRIARYVIYRETLIDRKDIAWSFTGAFMGVGLIGGLNHFLLPVRDNLFVIGSFGASAVLVYGHAHSPLAQPRNVIGGHVLSALVGVTCCMLIRSPDLMWLSGALAVAFSIVVMQVTKTVHPPGGATALLAVAGSEKIKHLGYLYALSPVASGVFLLLLIAFIVNNIPENRNYPAHGRWW
ncbi:HPP family protein [Chitinophaga cymbidii]|uniref:Membrane protein n=1 Tax=Chitinophaga cymbidii TaxID=1096750 RepID=A0A512RF97_9BACT|nr:HPP family protein [Chitinophaga cymbidii]GEP94314.1 membrane protein [Chitinophaga cymbidii]